MTGDADLAFLFAHTLRATVEADRSAFECEVLYYP